MPSQITMTLIPMVTECERLTTTLSGHKSSLNHFMFLPKEEWFQRMPM